MNVAAKCRAEKEAHPELYCADRRCLWHLSSGPCPKHPVAEEREPSQKNEHAWSGGSEGEGHRAIGEFLTTVNALYSRLAALERDAARLDWMQYANVIEPVSDDRDVWEFGLPRVPDDDLRAAIDAAMQLHASERSERVP